MFVALSSGFADSPGVQTVFAEDAQGESARAERELGMSVLTVAGATVHLLLLLAGCVCRAAPRTLVRDLGALAAHDQLAEGLAALTETDRNALVRALKELRAALASDADARALIHQHWFHRFRVWPGMASARAAAGPARADASAGTDAAGTDAGTDADALDAAGLGMGRAVGRALDDDAASGSVREV